MNLSGSKTEQSLKDAFAGESQANRRYLYFANQCDVLGEPDMAALFRSMSPIIDAVGDVSFADANVEDSPAANADVSMNDRSMDDVIV